MLIMLWVNQGTELCSWALQANKFTYNSRNQENGDYRLFPSTCSSFLKKALINCLYSCKTAETPLQLAAHLDVSSLRWGELPHSSGSWGSVGRHSCSCSLLIKWDEDKPSSGGSFPLQVGNAWQEPSSDPSLAVCRRVTKSPPVPLAGGHSGISE